MAEVANLAAKEEAKDDLDGPISSLNRKSLKKKELTSMDGIDEDDVPLAFSKAKKKNLSISSKVKKKELEDFEYEKPLKEMEGLKKKQSNTAIGIKEERRDDEDEKPLKKKVVLKSVTKSKSVKREDLVDSEEEEEENKKNKKKKRNEVKRIEVKVKKVKASQEKVKNDKKEKKVYELPGQKHDPPEMRDPLRIFYETLYEKVPTSEMAAIWMMERGLLSLEEAEKVYTKKLRKSHNQKLSSPAKFTTPVKRSSKVSVKKEVKVTSKSAVKTIKKKVIDSEEEDDDDDDDDFVLTKLGKKRKVSR